MLIQVRDCWLHTYMLDRFDALDIVNQKAAQVFNRIIWLCCNCGCEAVAQSVGHILLQVGSVCHVCCTKRERNSEVGKSNPEVPAIGTCE